MNDQFAVIRDLFLAALERDGVDAQLQYAEEQCAEKPQVHAKLVDMLKAHHQTAGFLASGVEATHNMPASTEAAGTRFGPYKVRELLGEGGMGNVYVAEQEEPVRRKVALKIIKPGMDSRQVIARFDAERHVLALMDHPHIARVLDAGTTEAGRPYFVMELVRGVPITEFCDKRNLTTRERLELFVKVCLAVQHAHQKGIIHRDIKPSNVLVTLHDDIAVPKVIDFGIAKATSQLPTEHSVYTGFSQMLGTPLYMSPEQAEMNALDIDTRSDVYSLGVLMYELIAGITPFDRETLKRVGFDEMRRLIREQEPLRPSERLSTLNAEARSTVSQHRGVDAGKLDRTLRGELDWIVMKALEKDRTRRYESAKDFAADVQRYQHDEPVQACPPSVGYRLRKLVRRHRGPVLAASLVVLALVVGIIGTTWGMLRATDAEAVAVNETKQKAEALTDKEAALTDAEEKLFLALVNRARAERSSGRVGQRFEALKAIREAAQIRITPELRTEAMAALVLPDAELAQEWERSIEDGLFIHFDASFQRYARLDKQGGVAVCRVSNGREEVITRLPAPGKSPFNTVLMSPDAGFVACRQVAGGVRVWKVDGPEPVVLEPEAPGIYEWAWAFHPNGRQLAIGHADKSVSVYELATGRRVQQLAVSAAPLTLAFSPREPRLAVACGNDVQLFDTGTGNELSALRHPEAVTYLSWHPNGRRLAVGCNDRKIHLWATETATEVISPWTGHTADGLIVVFNHAGDRLVSGDWSGQTRLWDAVAGRTLLTLPGVGGQFSSDDSLLGPEYSGNKIRLWRLAGGRELRVLRSRSAGILDNIVYPVIHADGRLLAAGAQHQLCFFDIVSGEELASVRLPRADAARPAYFDPLQIPRGQTDFPIRPGGPETSDWKSGLPEDQSGGWMVGGSSGLYLWPARPDSARPEVMRIGPPRKIAPDPGGGFSAGTSASADGRVVAVPQGNSTLVLYRDRPDRRVVLGPQYDVRFSAVSPDGRWVVTCSWGADARFKSGMRIWNAETGLCVHDLAMESQTKAKFSPDGRWLMTAGPSGSRQWEVGTWRKVRHFEPAGFVFSPDSRLLAICDVFSVIRLLETTTGREVARLTGPEPTGYSPACFTPDGTRIVATCSGETALHVWDLRLIRQQLKELGLDWDWPDFPPTDPGNDDAKPRQVDVLLGDLGALTSEQRARQGIERYRPLVAAEPDNALACNNLAWAYATAPEPFRDVKAAQSLAENAVRLEPMSAVYRNTLGVVYYRAERYREAVEMLRANLENQEDSGLACDLYFLAMSHQRLGEAARARDYYDWAVRWSRTDSRLTAGDLEELAQFRAEAAEQLGVKNEK